MFSFFGVCIYSSSVQVLRHSQIPHTARTDTQGCSAGLADTLCLAHLMTSHSDTKTKVSASQVQTTMSHLHLIYYSILTYTHFSCFTHIYKHYTFSLCHLAWESKKPFIISFIRLHFIQPKQTSLVAGLYITEIAHQDRITLLPSML